MDNRFGFKDFFLAGLMLLAIVVATTALIQIQRQGEAVAEVRRRIDQQDEILRRLDARTKPAAPAAVPAAPSTTSAR